MRDTFIYNERWMDSTEQRLRRQRQMLAELQDRLRAVRSVSGPEWADSISYALVRIDRLEQSLRKTGDVLEQFRERVETQNRQAVADYGEALIRARRVFS